jgi:uncharacterized DUF497 family protein
VTIDFDPAKDAANVAKHGVSLARAAEFEVRARVIDIRFEERRFRAYGLIDGKTYCLAYVIRDGRVRAISLRRAHDKEYRRHVR